MAYTADIDAGGTCTDGYVCDGERRWIAKVETTPHDLSEGLLRCLGEIARQIGVAELSSFLRQCETIRFCTTLATNALLEGRGTQLGLLVTAGSEEDLYGAAALPMVNRSMVAGIEEQVDDTGRVAQPPATEQVVAAARGLLARGAGALVVALRRSARQPANELAIQRILDREYPPHLLGHVPVILSHQISRRPEDSLRLNAAVLDARVHALLARALRETDDALRRHQAPRPMLVVHASGGCARVPKTRALHTYGSGPACFVQGAAVMATELGLDRVIAMDIGGTSTDIALIRQGKATLLNHGSIAHCAVGEALPEVHSVPLGGGTIAHLDGEQLLLGPRSAGARPGPACFGRGGTQPTPTDASLVLGILDPHRFLAGRTLLEPEAARQALQPLAERLGQTPEAAAQAIGQSLEQGIAATIREVAGREDLERWCLFAGGGGSGPHVARIAERLGITEVYAFAFSPVFGAFGTSTLDVAHIYQASLEQAAVGGHGLTLGPWFTTMIAAARRDVEDEGFDPSKLGYELRVELCGRDGTPQFWQGPVDVAQHEVELGELTGTPRVAWLHAKVDLPRRTTSVTVAHRVRSESESKRQVHWTAEAIVTPVVPWQALERGRPLPGPALVESDYTTLTVPAGWTAHLENEGWAILRH